MRGACILRLSAACLFILSAGALSPVFADPAQPLAFGAVADIQYADKEGKAPRDYRGSLARLEACVDDLNRQKLDFVVQLGDAVDGYPTNRVDSLRDYDRVMAAFRRLTSATYQVVGNHCLNIGRTSLEQRLGMSSFYYTFTRPAAQGWRFVVLDGNDGGYGVMSEAQLAWLQSVLNQAQQAGERVICFCHFPLLKEAAANHRMAKPAPVLKLLDASPCVVAWIAGHDHAGGYALRKGVHHVTLHGMVEASGSTAYARFELGSDGLREIGSGKEPCRDLPLDALPK